MTTVNPKFDPEICKVNTLMVEHNNHKYQVVVLPKIFDIDRYVQIVDTVFISKIWIHKLHEFIKGHAIDLSLYPEHICVFEQEPQYYWPVQSEKLDNLNLNYVKGTKIISMNNQNLQENIKNVQEIILHAPKDCEIELMLSNENELKQL